MKGITPQTDINDWLVRNGYRPVERDAEIHDCYLCLLHYRKLEDAPGVTERRIQGWVDTIYGEVA